MLTNREYSVKPYNNAQFVKGSLLYFLEGLLEGLEGLHDFIFKECFMFLIIHIVAAPVFTLSKGSVLDVVSFKTRFPKSVVCSDWSLSPSLL